MRALGFARAAAPPQLTPAARLGGVMSLIASLGGLLTWGLAPDLVRWPWLAAVGIAAAALIGAVYLLAPWDRLGKPALVVLLLAGGVPMIALACLNTGGMASPYTVFWAFIPFSVAHVGTRRELALAVVLSVIGAALPFAYDGVEAGADLARLLFLAAIGTAAGVLFQRTQEHVRTSDAWLRELVMRDELTGAANRRAVEERATLAIARARQVGGRLSLLYMDLDGFKQVNDTFGHAKGDEVLRTVVAAATGAVRDGDLVGRIGGDEFAALLPRAGSDEALRVAARVRELIERRLHGRGQLPRITISVGTATYPDDALNWEELLGVADRRLLEAKEAPMWPRGDRTLVRPGREQRALHALPGSPQPAG